MGKRKESNNGGLCCVQASLVVFNFITLLGGVATLAIGVWLFYESHATESAEASLITDAAELIVKDVSESDPFLKNKEFRGISILLIALGSLVTFISFLGCFGAFISSRCLLLSYLALVTVILIIQLILSTFIVIHRLPVRSSIREELMHYIKVEYQPNGPIGQAWDLVQIHFECCGVDGYKDWYDYKQWESMDRVPDSCCLPKYNATDCGQSGDPSNWNQQGCLPKIQFKILEQLHFFATAVITLVFLQLYGIIASTLLFYHAKSIHRSKSRPTRPSPTHTPYKAYGYERAGMI